MCDGESIEMENARFFFKDIEDRNNTMLIIMHQYTNYFIASLAIIWGFITTNPTPVTIFIGVLFTNSVLIFWRYFVHFIDNSIASNYSKLIYFEYVCYKNIQLPDATTILEKLLASATLSNQKIDEIKKMDIEKKIKIINNLVRERKMGYRGHDLFDTFVLCISGLIFGLLMGYLLSINECLLVMSTIICITVNSVAFVHLIENFQQQDPINADVEKALNC